MRYRRSTNVLCHDDRADHAGAEVALLAWGNEVFGHREIVGGSLVWSAGSPRDSMSRKEVKECAGQFLGGRRSH